MNERIKELAKQADGVFIHKLMTGAKQYTFLEKDLEKFAELIVRECADVAKETRWAVPPSQEQIARASACQALGHRFETDYPLQIFSVRQIMCGWQRGPMQQSAKL